MAMSIPEDAILDPIAWAVIARENGGAREVHDAVVRRLSQIFDVSSCGLVLGLQLPKEHHPGKGIEFPEPERRHGDFLSRDWTEYSAIHGSEDPLPKQVGPYARPYWLYNGSRDRSALAVGHEQFFKALDGHGFRSGIFLSSMQVDAGTLDVAGLHSDTPSREFAKLEAHFSRQLHLAFAFFSEGLAMERRKTDFSSNVLSPRERECLLWTVAGNRTSEIGERLKLSDATVTEYLTSARRKLGAGNRIQACARAVLSGVLEP